MKLQLEGRTALVTGAARGQGRAHARALASAGAAVVVCDIGGTTVETIPYTLGSTEDLQETVELIEKDGGTARAIVVDIRRSSDVTDAVNEAVKEFGRLDILVANAAVIGFAQVSSMSDAQWNDVIDTNLTGTFNCVRAALNPMIAQSYGRIIVISSMSGRGGNPNAAHYSAAKFGVIGLAKATALEVARQGITVNVLCPTSADTPMIHNDATYRLFCPELDSPTIDDVRPRFAELNPMGIPWVPPDVFSRAVLFFAADEGYVTGTVLEMSPGISASKP